jgi:hypothetical protein
VSDEGEERALRSSEVASQSGCVDLEGEQVIMNANLPAEERQKLLEQGRKVRVEGWK